MATNKKPGNWKKRTLAVIDFEISSWKKLTPCSGKLVDFVRPRDL